MIFRIYLDKEAVNLNRRGKGKFKKIYRKMVPKPPPLSTSQGADYALRVLEQSVRQPRDLLLTPQGVRVL